MALTLPASRRLKTGAQFRTVYTARQSQSDDRIIVYRLANGLGHPRLGISVSKKIGNAVVRNRWKRLIREVFRHLQHSLPALDYVVLPRPGVEPVLVDLQRSFTRLVQPGICS